MINFDLETTSLEIKTGSGFEQSVFFYTAQEDYVGGVAIRFSPSPQYYIYDCTWTDFPTQLPSASVKVWRITKTRTSGIRLRIQCNEKEVLNILMSDSTCSYSNWRRDWTSDNIKIYFTSSDTASDFYRPYSAGKLINDILSTT